MKTISFMLLLGLLALFACQPAVPTQPAKSPTPSIPPCNKPGTVLSDSVTETTRGYAYNFQVYLPPCYEAEPDRFYPVIYLLPGRGSSQTTWFAAGAHKMADELILSGQVPPFLIITTEDISSDMYADAIHQELVPYVESSYRVLADREHRAVAGGSLGGIGAYRLAFRFPDQFSSTGMFGSGLISGEEAQVQEWLAAIPPENMPQLFLNVGEEDPLMLDRAQVMIAILDQMGISSTAIFSPGEHSYTYWVSNLPAYFRWLAERWKPNYELRISTLPVRFLHSEQEKYQRLRRFRR